MADKKKRSEPEKEQPEEQIETPEEEIKEPGIDPTEFLQDKSELVKAQELAEEYKRKWYAVSAEYDNFRKRNAQAVSRAYSDGAADAILKILPVADTFGYAMDAAADEKTKAGIDKVIKNFKTILSSLGVEEIPISVGDDFDESVAEAVMNFPCEEGEKPNVIRNVLKKGYRSKDKVIRFAQVSVTI